MSNNQWHTDRKWCFLKQAIRRFPWHTDRKWCFLKQAKTSSMVSYDFHDRMVNNHLHNRLTNQTCHNNFPSGQHMQCNGKLHSTNLESAQLRSSNFRTEYQNPEGRPTHRSSNLRIDHQASGQIFTSMVRPWSRPPRILGADPYIDPQTF